MVKSPPVAFIVACLLVSPAALAGRPAQNRDRLDPRIPAPSAAKYKNVHDVKHWVNPKFLIRSEGIEVTSRSIEVTRNNFGSGANVVPLADLAALLIKLPVTDWPYGRVVLAQEIGLRSLEPGEDSRISENHKAADRVFKALNVVVQWVPSA